MSNLYKNIVALCEEKGIKGGKMCTDTGISKGLLTDLKMGRRTGVSAKTAQKIASYFGVSVGYLLGEEETTKEIETINESLSDIIITLSNDNELLDIVEMVTKLDAEKRKVLKSFLTTFVAE
jgi:transcriptional regulator with XRE-family HTH domain